jgi:hypothetical protein
MANVPDDLNYSEPPPITVWDYDDLSPEVVGVLYDQRGDVMKVIERPRRAIGFKPW